MKYYRISFCLNLMSVKEHGLPSLSGLLELGFEFGDGQSGQYARRVFSLEELREIPPLLWKGILTWQGKVEGWTWVPDLDGSGSSFDPRNLQEVGK